MEGQIKRDGCGKFMKGNSYTHSEKTKQKMSNSAMGKIISVEQRIQISNTLIEKYRSGKLCPSRLGKNNSTETKEKMSKTRKKLFEQGKLKVWNKDKHLSEETKRKIRLRTQKPEFREMMRLHALEQFKNGMPEESIRKMIESKKRNNTLKHTEGAKIKISKSLKGHKVSKGTVEKMLETRRKNNSFKHTEETKERLRQYIGEKTSNWRGGISFEPYTPDFNKKIKKMIKERDGKCMLCNINLEDLKLLKRKIDIHHIDYDKKNSFPQNLITLCMKCHGLTQFNRNRWTTFYQKLLSEEYKYQYTEDQKIILDFT